MDYIPNPKMPRLSREAVITEKIDGTSSTIWISEDGLELRAGSRNRWITPTDDNYGFARWVECNHTELFKLGPGWHRGEWWGQGIQRNYGVPDKRFSLFNASRWSPSSPECGIGEWCYSFNGVEDAEGVKINCCRVVPTIWRGTFDTFDINSAIEMLKSHGSFASPGFRNPEGIVIYHAAAKILFKKTIESDESAKGTAYEVL